MGWKLVVTVLFLTTCAAAPTSKRDENVGVEKLEDLKNKLKELKEELLELGEILKNEEKDYDKRDKITKPKEDIDDDIKDIIDKISPEDLELLRQYSNRATNFIKAVKEDPDGLEPDQTPEQLPVEETPNTKPVLPVKPDTKPFPPKPEPAPQPDLPQTEPSKRNQVDDELADYISKLSPEDQRMLEGMESRLHYLQTALHTPGSTENEVEKEEPSKRNDGEFSKDVQPEDAEILKNLKTRLNTLRVALKYKKENAAHVGAEDFGKFKEKRQEWADKALPNNELGAKSDGEDTLIDYAKEAERRFLKDVEYAREHGVKISDLLRSLKTRKVEQLRQEEKELEQLGLRAH